MTSFWFLSLLKYVIIIMALMKSEGLEEQHIHYTRYTLLEVTQRLWSTLRW